MKWTLLCLIMLAGIIFHGVTADISTWQDVAIVEAPAHDPKGLPESSPNMDCIIGIWDRWHDACNARQVKVI